MVTLGLCGAWQGARDDAAQVLRRAIFSAPIDTADADRRVPIIKSL